MTARLIERPVIGVNVMILRDGRTVALGGRACRCTGLRSPQSVFAQGGSCSTPNRIYEDCRLALGRARPHLDEGLTRQQFLRRIDESLPPGVSAIRTGARWRVGRCLPLAPPQLADALLQARPLPALHLQRDLRPPAPVGAVATVVEGELILDAEDRAVQIVEDGLTLGGGGDVKAGPRKNSTACWATLRS